MNNIETEALRRLVQREIGSERKQLAKIASILTGDIVDRKCRLAELERKHADVFRSRSELIAAIERYEHELVQTKAEIAKFDAA